MKADKPLKIVQLITSNVKRIKAVEVTPDPDGNLVVIGGNNGEGKSSLLDSILYALAGGRSIPAMPVRDGEKEAKITIDLGEYIVERTLDASGKGKLKVSMGEGAKVMRPQEFLNGLMGSLSFDPEEFSRMAPRDQRNLLIELAQVDTTEIDKDIDSAQYQLTNERAVFKAASDQLEGMEAPEADPNFDLVDVLELTQTIDIIRQKTRKMEEVEHDVSELTARNREMDDEIKRLQNEQTLNSNRIAELADSAVEMGAAITALPGLQETVNRIATAEQQNDDIKYAQRYAEVEERVQEKGDTVDELKLLLSEHKEQRVSILDQAEMPVEGLGFDENCVTFGDLPFDQLASSEQLRISMAMAMALNPRLRVIRIMNGSLLDDVSREIVRQMAAEKGYQVWMEVVGKDESATIIIEDGMVRDD